MVNAFNAAIRLADADDVSNALSSWELSDRPITDETQEMSVGLVEDLAPRPGQQIDDWDDRALRPSRRGPTG